MQAYIQTIAQTVDSSVWSVARVRRRAHACPNVLRPHPMSCPYAVHPELSSQLSVQHFDMRWVFGGLPYFGEGTRDMGGWWRYKDFDGAHDDTDDGSAAILSGSALRHAVGCTSNILPLIEARSRLQYDVVCVCSAAVLFKINWMLYRADVAHAANGYGQTQAHIWNASGIAMQSAAKLVAVFD